MSFLLRRLGPVLGLAVCAAAAACSSEPPEIVPHPTIQPPPSTLAIGFDGGGRPLSLGLGAAQVLSVSAAPAGRYDVRFALIDTSLDAALDASIVTTDASGHASVTLRAPSQATSFRVRASILGEGGVPAATAAISIAAVDQGFGVLQITPSYGGPRTISEWTVSVVPHASCADIDSMLPGDLPGALTVTAPFGGALEIDNAPVGAPLAVALRAGHFAWGCADASPLTDDATAVVTVPIADKLLDLTTADLAFSFSFAPDPVGYGIVLGDAVLTLAEAFVPESDGDGSTLLDAMGALVPPGQAGAFHDARMSQGWDAIAAAQLALPGRGLRDTCIAWATAGMATLPTSFQANVTSGSTSQAVVDVTGFAGLAPAAAGVTTAPTSTWVAQPGDTMLLQGALYFEPSRLAASAAIGPAVAAEPTATTVAEALALASGCEDLATALGPFGSCDVSCVAGLCKTAVAARWSAAVGASKQAAALGHVTFQASASADIDDTATPISLTGQWLGDVTDPLIDVQVKGSLSAMKAAPPTTP